MQTVAGATSPEELYHSIIEGYKVCYTQCAVDMKLTIPCMHSMELLVDLLKSPDLYVMQVEMDVYTLAKRVGLYP